MQHEAQRGRRTRAVARASSFAAAALVLAGLIPTANAAPECGDPRRWDPSGNITAKQAGWGRLIQLRYNTRNRCAWGKIVNSQGDETIWVDHSTTNGNGWEGPLSVTTCRGVFGCPNLPDWSTDIAYSDAGTVMRACMQTPDGRITCTEWY